MRRIDDGIPYTTPVGSFRANAFGLHDVCGNVSEWCRDHFGRYDDAFEAGDGLRRSRHPRQRLMRGGSFRDPELWQRSAKRQYWFHNDRDQSAGVRAVRALER